MKTVGRDKIRKKPLEHFCYQAEIIRDGEDNMYVYCRGVNLNECTYCDAYRPLEDWEIK